MTATARHVIVLSTAPDEASARALAERLVEDGLAACVNIVPGMTSIYRWQGALQREQELLLIVKTRASLAEAAVRALVRAHPYEVPEAVVLPLTGGHGPYLAWLDENTAGAP